MSEGDKDTQIRDSRETGVIRVNDSVKVSKTCLHVPCLRLQRVAASSACCLAHSRRRCIHSTWIAVSRISQEIPQTCSPNFQYIIRKPTTNSLQSALDVLSMSREVCSRGVAKRCTGGGSPVLASDGFVAFPIWLISDISTFGSRLSLDWPSSRARSSGEF